MATLALGLVGTAIGAGIGGGITVLGATLTAASIGGIVGSTIGGYVDSMIIASLTPAIRNEGPRLQEITVMQSTEGAVVGRLHGILRVGGNLIWAARFKETKTTESERVGGKIGGQTVETTTYTYSCSFAVAFGEGNERTQLGRLWMDGKEVDLSIVTFTFYRGTETQLPDSVIQSVEGAGATPAFRGTCYIVFEDLELRSHSNRIPQVTAEIINPLETDDPDDISNIARSFCLIPGSGEFVYGTDVYTVQNASNNVLDNFYPGGSFTNRAGDTINLPSRSDDNAASAYLNMHNQRGEADFVSSMTQLELFQPNLDAVLLVVGWFGDDLRIDQCELRPYVEYKDRDGVVTPREWNVAGLVRSDADVLEVGRDGEGNPIHGGTPSDDVVIEAIQWLKARGHRVIFYPFIFMHVESGNTLPNPYSDNALDVGQPVFPWRGRITCSPAAGYTGTVDKTAAAATQVNTFFTRTWGFNNMVEHYAQLCDDAGGVDAFLIGTEMVGMTTIRSATSIYPAVSHLQTLASTVSGIMGSGTKVSYAADWSEYHSHRPNDGTGDVHFHLDPLWADANIDFIGIDNYLPISDWRDGSAHLDYDADAGIVTPHNVNYLKSNIEGGEYYDWYYASDADRDSQTRTVITDGSYSKPWVFRQKDISNWWSNAHYNRPGGVESGSPTAYTAGTKPIWFTEFGCPSVDKGTNQPNAFYDPKSSESLFPYHSNGQQDEYISRVYVEAMLQYWRDNSPVGMLDIDNMFIWTWDARPFPDYPSRTDVWSDGDLHRYGHWMTGRIAYPALPRLIEYLCEEVGVTDYNTEQLNGTQGLVKGYYIDNITAVRDIIASLMTGFQFDAFESEGKIKFVLKQSTSVTALDTDDFVSTSGDAVGFTITRAQNTELPKRIIVDFIDAYNDYEVSSLDAKRHQTTNNETASIRLPISLAPDYVRGLADSILHQSWVARESGTLNLPPSLFKLDPADGITFPLGEGGRVGQARIQSIENGEFREVSFRAFDPSLYTLPVYPEQIKSSILTQVPGFPELFILDIPLYSGDEPSHWSPRLAAFANPWPGSVAVYRDADPDPGTDDWVLGRSLNLENVMGVLTSAVGTGKTGTWLRNQTITVTLLGGTLPSADSDVRVLNGDNVCAMQNNHGHWEIFQYKTATLNGNGSYTLSDLIRGQLGTEWVMNEGTFDGGNNFVLLENQFSINPSTAPYLPLTPGDRDVTISLRFGSAYKSVDDDNAYLETTFTHEAMAKKPYAPVHLKARWNLSVNNNIALSWIRRTRFDGDAWELASIPLNEEVEEYELEILNGSTVVREVTNLTSPAYTYTDAMQVADFGSAQTTSIKIRVYQMSPAVGRGIPAEETITR
ncbi:MAG: hypothetical protein GOVbin4933_77 [Prokaryotic dsDNA virus sp.]|nr:MAG: hypothetical protein GOVbin4933_77 [Prokaryotic dsDNA virus sp.]|tara:strand:+ start:1085 stop:5146 length:4062 start_codon:yes stop_codon:yes gene_type:complete